ncbi:LOW QUALITY PROTEIN: Hypothetical protein PHPALM_19079 [Phytophthora palmivora]|uniref:Uncharacterized protein n=1 Tax=Phytophthora palmivora TaxID=4796 RepID=A0A2P4XI53_9STRA|nr:LOW QUALITY PROTEIN: Hypothetical protein PHPALM_19079 [Phytophthora palmivora]
MLRRVCQRVSKPLSSSFSVAVESRQHSRSRYTPRSNRTPKLRYEDKRMGVLLSPKTRSDSFVFACRTLRCKDEIKLLASTDPRAWNVALQRRMDTRDERGAAELLGLVASFARENASEPIWTDLLFTVLRHRSSRAYRTEEIYELLDQLTKRYGPQFVARVLTEVVNGCANINMFAAAHELLLYHQKLWPEIREKEWGLSSLDPLMPPSIVGHLLAKMAQKKKHKQLLKLATEYFAHPEFDAARDFQQQGFFALFEASVKMKESPREIVRTFLDYVDGSVRTNGGDLEETKSLVLERGFGAAIQCCVTLEEFSLALHCYSSMENMRERIVGDSDVTTKVPRDEAVRVRFVDKVLPIDENMCVNVMKACMAIKDFSMLKDVFREMIDRGVARSGGFGSAIRYCHEHLDPDFLEEVLNEVSATEQELAGSWMLKITTTRLAASQLQGNLNKRRNSSQTC